MKYTLDAQDYYFLHSELKKQFPQDGNRKNLPSQCLYQFLKDEIGDHQYLDNLLEKRLYEDIPKKSILQLEDLLNWPEIANYKIQKRFQGYFKQKGFDLGQFYQIVSCTEKLTDPFKNLRHKTAPVYAKGVLEDIFNCPDEAQAKFLIQYLDKINKYNKQDNTILSFIDKYPWKEKTFVYQHLNFMLGAVGMKSQKDMISTDNPIFQKIIHGFDEVPEKYHKLHLEFIYKESSCIENEYLAFHMKLNLDKMAKDSSVPIKQIKETLDNLNYYYNEDTKKEKGINLLNFGHRILTGVVSEYSIVAFFEDDFKRKEFKNEINGILKMFKEINYQLNQDIESMWKHFSLAKKLNDMLEDKSSNKVLKI